MYAALEGKTSGAIRGNISNASHPSQSMFLASLQSGTHQVEKDRNREIIRERYLRVKEVLEAHPEYGDYFEALPFNSGYFMCIRLKRVSAEKLRVHLLEKYGVGLIAIGDTNLRIAFSCLEEGEIPELFNIILQGIQDIEGYES